MFEDCGIFGSVKVLSVSSKRWQSISRNENKNIVKESKSVVIKENVETECVLRTSTTSIALRRREPRTDCAQWKSNLFCAIVFFLMTQNFSHDTFSETPNIKTNSCELCCVSVVYFVKSCFFFIVRCGLERRSCSEQIWPATISSSPQSVPCFCTRTVCRIVFFFW